MGCSGSNVKDDKVKMENVEELKVLESKKFDVLNSKVFREVEKIEKEQTQRYIHLEEDALMEPIVVWRDLNMETETFYSLINELGKNQNIVDFTINNFEVDGNCDIMVNLARILMKKTTLQRLELTKVIKMSEKGVKSIAKILEGNRELETLVLSNLKFEAKDGKYLKIILSEIGKNLTYFELSDISIDFLFIDLLSGLKNNESIKELVLTNLNLYEHDFIKLMNTIEYKTMINCINFSGNCTKDGMNIFLEKEFPHLQTIGLNKCSLEDKDFKILLEGIRENKTLKTLELKENKITEQSSSALKQFFDGNSTLMILDLSHNDIKKDQLYDVLSTDNLAKIICDFTLTTE
jgi:hypothetical protein